MVTKQEVVTPTRFASGASYSEFTARIEKNVDLFASNYDNTKVSSDLEKRLKAVAARPNGPKKLLVLGEDWCPDVFRGLPVLARIAEAGGIEFKAFFRDQNLDIMNAYLNKGEFQSIPTALFYTGDLDLILVWHERPDKANEEMPALRSLYANRTREEAMPDVQEFYKGPIWAGWRDATVEEIAQKLESATA